MSLNVNRKIFEIHHDHIELFLIFMKNDDLFITIFFFDRSLIKIFLNIHYRYINTLNYCCNNVCLNEHEINVWLNDFIQFTNIHHNTFFSCWFFVVYRDFSNHENEIFERSEMFRSLHFFCSWNLLNVLSINFWFFISTKYIRYKTMRTGPRNLQFSIQAVSHLVSTPHEKPSAYIRKNGEIMTQAEPVAWSISSRTYQPPCNIIFGVAKDNPFVTHPR